MARETSPVYRRAHTGIPVIAALTAWVVRGERPTPVHAVGAVLIVAGVLVSRRR